MKRSTERPFRKRWTSHGVGFAIFSPRRERSSTCSPATPDGMQGRNGAQECLEGGGRRECIARLQ